MSEKLETAAEALRGKVSGSGFTGSVKFDVEEEGVIRIDGEEVTLADGAADCTITASIGTFQEMFQGELDPTSAFMTGKIRIDGDMGVAMKLAQVL